MNFERLIVKNFRTYRDLDVDLRVSGERPLVLIGGMNSAGKTTFFEAIVGALYGLSIRNAEEFRQQLNVGVSLDGVATPTIELTLVFRGMVLSQEKTYILTRTWHLNSQNEVNFGVKLNLEGNVIQYGSASITSDKIKSESEIAKMIKANLPKELSEYFLFDTLRVRDKLAEDQLGKVIRENIENVMGLRKFGQMSKVAEGLRQKLHAERLKAEGERKAYLDAQRQRELLNDKHMELSNRLAVVLDDLADRKETIDELRGKQDQEKTLREQVSKLRAQLDEIHVKERKYRNQLVELSGNIHQHVGLGQLAHAVKPEFLRLLNERRRLDQDLSKGLNADQWGYALGALRTALESKGIVLDQPMVDELLLALVQGEAHVVSKDKELLSDMEYQALNDLIRGVRSNPFAHLYPQKQELELAIVQIPRIEGQIKDYESMAMGNDFGLLAAYDEMERESKRLQSSIENVEADLNTVETLLRSFDLEQSEEPDPKYEAMQKLKLYFDRSSEALLRARKSKLEEELCRELNLNILAYKGFIDRVELSEKLSDFSLKIYHVKGNEIPINTLNAASKQILIQVLLKALHVHGDYNPPVMIDTVMGNLDSQTKAVLLEHYFPTLAHQTILLSNDEEIDVKVNLPKLSAFVSKVYTLHRDAAMQMTTVQEDYFGVTLEEVL